ncbi:VOC family protein [Streptomyces hoynatensis]|uniref:VOC family protein n=1 Tax=Streptomyces hoynatensis TaxID=1141874 RepID=A0A3A9YY25_9ACTN|nr:VOC family protein [Streptomyces hoynatensis]RKN40126.1 VOC family protein [Streptomyces hoynatensis]
MNQPPAWFDITALDANRSREFYGQLFGWEVRVDASMDYGLTQTPEGVAGGIGQATEDGPHPAGLVMYFPVADVDAALGRAEALGGSCAVPPWEIPGLGKMAVFRDPDGNRVGLWQR